VHIHEWAVRLIFLRVGAEEQNVAIGIFHLHLVRPWIIGGRVAEFGAAIAQFGGESFGVFYADASSTSIQNQVPVCA
jgi:hypothetical protein